MVHCICLTPHYCRVGCRLGSSRWLGKLSLRSFLRGETKAGPDRGAESSLCGLWRARNMSQCCSVIHFRTFHRAVWTSGSSSEVAPRSRMWAATVAWKSLSPRPRWRLEPAISRFLTQNTSTAATVPYLQDQLVGKSLESGPIQWSTIVSKVPHILFRFRTSGSLLVSMHFVCDRCVSLQKPELPHEIKKFYSEPFDIYAALSREFFLFDSQKVSRSQLHSYSFFTLRCRIHLGGFVWGTTTRLRFHVLTQQRRNKSPQTVLWLVSAIFLPTCSCYIRHMTTWWLVLLVP